MGYNRKWSLPGHSGFESYYLQAVPFSGLSFSIRKMGSAEEGGWTQCSEGSCNLFSNSLFPTPPTIVKVLSGVPWLLGVCYEVSSSVPFHSLLPGAIGLWDVFLHFYSFVET